MNSCRICGWKGVSERITVFEMMQGSREGFEYFVCPECNCIQIAEVPKNLYKYYGEKYYSYKQPDISKVDCASINEARILDVGCGAGSDLCEWARNGYVNLYGCDPFITEDLQYDNGVKIYKKTIHEMEGIFDTICLSDSLEHMTDPHEVMDSICRLLAPGGVAQITIPVFPNIAYELFGVNWFQLDAPRHIFIPSKESLRYLAQAHGLKIAATKYNSNNSQIVVSYLYEKGIPLVEQNPEIMSQYFEQEDLLKFNEYAEQVNEKEYGDHAIFWLVHEEIPDDRIVIN